MHRGSIPSLVYRHLFPNPQAGVDPNSFPTHLRNNLVPEVRSETSTFYGSLDCTEARYPGLDYTHPPHRMRLGRFPHHQRLFRAFDELGLTKEEIFELCRWEGTKWARESYERQEGIKVEDTTGNEIPLWSPPMAGTSAQRQTNRSELISVTEDDDVLVDTPAMNDDEDESEEEIESVGVELNQRLSAAAEARARGADVVMDEAWEQWLKEASERGVLTDPTSVLRSGLAFSSTMTAETRAVPANNPVSTPSTTAPAETAIS
ncbi:MAG: hypothetical protein M1825_000498 [Sarcosagium campestre]|nr:MAG: hypothetical protein M1825_000498 [Sarcosagium campestre]